jgi:hypothetical protein
MDESNMQQIPQNPDNTYTPEQRRRAAFYSLQTNLEMTNLTDKYKNLLNSMQRTFRTKFIKNDK